MKKSELKALIKEVIKETHIHQAMVNMGDANAKRKKEQEYKSKLEKYYQAAKGHWPEKREYESDVRSAGKSLGYSESQIRDDLNRYTKPEDEPVMNNFIFESKLKELIREVIEEATTNSPISYPEAIDLLAKEEAQRYINSGNSKRMNISDDAMSVVELLFGKTKQEIFHAIETASRKELQSRAGAGNWKKSL